MNASAEYVCSDTLCADDAVDVECTAIVLSMYDYIAEFSFAAICLFIPSVPVTHCLGLVAHSPKSAKLRYLLLYPVKGGKHHLIFQIISWVWPLLTLHGIFAVCCPIVGQQ